MPEQEHSYATAQRRVRGLGSSGSGTSDFIVERVTSVALALLTPYVVFVAIVAAGMPRQYAISWIGWWGFAPFLALFVVISIIHMRVGMRVIIEDYVHQPIWKMSLLLVNAFFCWTVMALALFAIALAAMAELR